MLVTRNELTRRFPKASQSFIKANLCAGDAWEAAKLESNPSHAPLEAKEVQRPIGERFLVSVTSVRKRLLDEDNLCEKYHVDLCRYAGVLPSDTPEQTSIKVSQRKCAKGEEEKVEITVDTIL